jgi:AcrR family transcriptional regulator
MCFRIQVRLTSSGRDATLRGMEPTPIPPPRVRSRERQREDTHQRIYAAAMEIFRRDGFEVARVDDVAKAAGVSHGTFYFHFATKDEVLIQCLRASEVRVVAALSVVPVGAPLLAVLDAAGAAIALEWEGDPKLFPDVAMVATRYLFRGHLNQMASASPAAPTPAVPARAPNPPPAVEPKSLTAAALAIRFGAAAARGELSPLLPAEVLANLCLVNLFAATLSWCSDPAARPLALMLAGMSRLFLDGVRGAVV